MDGPVVAGASAAPAPPLAHLLGGYHGSRYAGFAPGVHLGLPSGHPELIICLDDDPLRLAALPDRTQSARSFRALAAGLQTAPAVIAHDGHGYSVSCQLTPAGVRSLLGVPAAALAGAVVSLDELLGRPAHELVERMIAASDWDARFAVLDEVLLHRAGTNGGSGSVADAAVAYAWRRIVGSGGAVRIGELAAETGFSRQHLRCRFAGEFGLTPKQFARVVRFNRSARLLREHERVRRRQPTLGRVSLAELAARCGYYDQAHLTREWNDLAGCSPSAWLAVEELPFVQASGAELLASSAP